MQVVAYEGKEAPEGFEWCSHIITEQQGASEKGETRARVLGFHPVVFRGSSQEDVTARAHNWWADQVATEAKKIANRQATSERMKARAK